MYCSVGYKSKAVITQLKSGVANAVFPSGYYGRISFPNFSNSWQQVTFLGF